MSYNSTKGSVMSSSRMGRSTSPQSQGMDMDMDMVLLWTEGEVGHSLELPKSIS